MVEMIFKGHVGILNGQLIFLFQCPKCKEVQIASWVDSGTVRCKICKGI